MGIASILIIGLVFAGVGEDFQERTKLNFPFKIKKEILYKVHVIRRIKLPTPDYRGIILEDAIRKRRSIRDYRDEAISLKELSNLLFSAQGITGRYLGIPLRAAPSAGALYPFEIYIYAHNIEGLERGIYHYDPLDHYLEFIRKGDFRQDLFKAGLYQNMFLKAPLIFIYVAVFERTTQKYGDRGYRYIYIEAGHIAENVFLESVSLGLGSCVVGAFFDDMINRIIGVDGKRESAIYIQTIGRPR